MSFDKTPTRDLRNWLSLHCYTDYTAWWFGTCLFHITIGNVIVPTDFYVFFFRKVETTNQYTIWVDNNDLTATSLESSFNKVNPPKRALFQVSELFQFTQILYCWIQTLLTVCSSTLTVCVTLTLLIRSSVWEFLDLCPLAPGWKDFGVWLSTFTLW